MTNQADRADQTNHADQTDRAMPDRQRSVAERYRTVAATFTERVRGTRVWDAPTPVRQWRARDVVEHLTSWLPPMIGAGSSITFVPVPSPREDPVGAWLAFDRQVQSLLDDPSASAPGDRGSRCPVRRTRCPVRRTRCPLRRTRRPP